MNPAWNRARRHAYARTCLQAGTGPIPVRKALRIAHSAARGILLTLAGIACLTAGYAVGTVTNAAIQAPATPCQTETSTWCHWDAHTQGNGTGRSFTVLWDGAVLYGE